MSGEVVRLTGTNERPAPTRLLRAGRLQATLVEGGLRTIRFDGIEVLRAIAYVVRDRDWGTYAPAMSEERIEQGEGRFAVSYRARCVDRDSGQALSVEARIEAEAGSLRFAVSATPDTAFLTARCGFAVLHPLRGVVGAPARIVHVDGSVRDARFPELIEPWQPFLDIRAITHWPADGVEACCLLEGDTFEMEDQRAWSDASFKTYVRPIALPWPYTLPAGIENRQSVTLRIADRRAEPVGSAAHADGGEAWPVRLQIGARNGTMPAIGVAIHPEHVGDILDWPDVLRTLAPQRLLFHYDPTAGHGQDALRGFAAVSAILPGAERGLEVAVPAQAPLVEEMRGLREDLAASGFQPQALMLSPAVDRQSTPPGSAWPDCPPLEDLYRAAREVFPDTPVGGGMLSYFTELNRKRPPVHLLDFVSHCTCPIVHAADDLSVMQSLAALPDIVRSCRAIIGADRPYRIGPSTIGMRQNPYGSRVMPNPDGVRMTMTDRDPRQSALFAAAWTVGYAAATEAAHLDGWVPAALWGPMGVAVLQNGAVLRHPVFQVVRALAASGGRARLPCWHDGTDRIAAVAALGDDGAAMLWLANLAPAEQMVALPDGPGWSVLTTEGDLGDCVLDAGLVRLGPYGVLGLRRDPARTGSAP